MGRRGNGEGTIYQRKDGRWCAALMGRDGKRAWIYGPTRGEVAAKLSAAIEKRRKGLAVVSDQTRLAEFMARWLDGARGSVKTSTWLRYRSSVRTHIVPGLGKISLARLQPHHLQRLYADMRAAGAASASIRNVHMVLRRALGQAERWGLVPRNVAALVDAPRFVRAEITTFDEDQVRRFLSSAAEERIEALYVLAVTTGMREGELLALRWRDVDLDKGQVRVQHTLSPAERGFELAEPKTARARRRIELAPTAVDALRRHRTAQAKERVALGPAWDDLDLVFANEIGRPIEPQNLVRRSFARVLTRAGLPRIRFHDLRHTAATLLLGGGIHPKVASEMLGHSTVAITLDLYSHVTPAMQREAAALMDRVVGGAR